MSQARRLSRAPLRRPESLNCSISRDLSVQIRFVGVLVTLIFSAVATAGQLHKRAIQCKTPQNARACYWTHGRLGSYNGAPAFHLWKIGTNRLLGIYSGSYLDRYGLDNENPQIPTNLRRIFKPSQNQVFSDFEVCPLGPEREGAMQSACIESAKNLVAR